VAKISQEQPGPPGKDTLISPTGTINTNTPTYTWNAVQGATWYYLYVNDAGTNSGKIQTRYTAAQAGCASDSGTCSATPSTSLAAGTANWWIQTWNVNGYGPWSDAMSFVVSPAGPPGKATLISPTGTINTNTPTYTWNAVPGATYYLLFVNDSTTRTGKIITWYTAANAGCGSGTGTCSVTSNTALAPGQAYWWVLTWNDLGYGPWSDGMEFTVSSRPPGKATLISPNGTITTRTPTFSWNAVPGSMWYQLWVDDTGKAGKVTKWYSAEEAGCPTGTGTCKATPGTTLDLGGAQWWIQTWNWNGNGPWSDGMRFTVTQGSTGDVVRPAAASGGITKPVRQ